MVVLPFFHRDFAILVLIVGLNETIHLLAMLLTYRLNSYMACLSKKLFNSQLTTFVCIHLIELIFSVLHSLCSSLGYHHLLRLRQTHCLLPFSTSPKDLVKDAIFVSAHLHPFQVDIFSCKYHVLGSLLIKIGEVADNPNKVQGRLSQLFLLILWDDEAVTIREANRCVKVAVSIELIAQDVITTVALQSCLVLKLISLLACCN